MNMYILQKHRKRFKIQPLFHFVSFIDGAFPILTYNTEVGNLFES